MIREPVSGRLRRRAPRWVLLVRSFRVVRIGVLAAVPPLGDSLRTLGHLGGSHLKLRKSPTSDARLRVATLVVRTGLHAPQGGRLSPRDEGTAAVMWANADA